MHHERICPTTNIIQNRHVVTNRNGRALSKMGFTEYSSCTLDCNSVTLVSEPAGESPGAAKEPGANALFMLSSHKEMLECGMFVAWYRYAAGGVGVCCNFLSEGAPLKIVCGGVGAEFSDGVCERSAVAFYRCFGSHLWRHFTGEPEGKRNINSNSLKDGFDEPWVQ